MPKIALIAISAAVGSLAVGEAALADTFVMHLEGVIDSQVAPGSAPESRFGMGTTVTVDASWSSAQMFPWSGGGYQLAGIFGTEATGGSFEVKFGAEDYQGSGSDQQGGAPVLTYDTFFDLKSWAAPVVAFKDGHVLGLSGIPSPLSTNDPAVFLGSSINAFIGQYDPSLGFTDVQDVSANFSPTFFIMNDGFDVYMGPEYSGTWDFADSSVVDLSAVPEPDAWVLMISGFAAAGGALRRRRARATA